ncbi:OmpA family protein [Halosquirtibacter xylanolyticus]|uniref:OmpA family protein n=1 Tax=Halosquirtibacter xylanolyticus TaxID=3374599 RepID=UPI003749E7BF|nr:OmpA family protein [Prolixibacteraceae bacterium]
MNKNQQRGLQIGIFVAFFLMSIPLFAQYSVSKSAPKKHYKQALESFYGKSYKRSLFYINKSIKGAPHWVSPYLLAAEVYYYIGNDSLQLESLKKVIELDVDIRYPKSFLNMANLEKKTHHFDIAIKYYRKFLKYTKESDSTFIKDVKLRLASSEFAKEAIASPIEFSPFSLGVNINTKEDEYWPSLSIDESTLVFTRLLRINPVTGLNYPFPQEDFYESKKKEKSWSNSKNMGYPINTPENEGAQCISADGRLLFFTACNRFGGKGSCDIYVSMKQANNRWSSPKNLGRSVNTSGWESQPSISADGRYLFFVSNRKGGKGKTDIYRAERTDYDVNGAPVFGVVEPLNEHVNTVYSETSPFIHPDGRTLYFSSNGWPSIGKSDIYISRLDKNKRVVSRKNIGYPINTFENDEAFVVGASGTFAYFVSDRDRKMGKDIYAFLLKENKPDPVSFVHGRVIDAETKRPLKANIVLTELQKGDTEAVLASWEDNGEFIVSLPLQKNYRFTSQAKGYIFYSKNFNLSKQYSVGNPYEVLIEMKRLVIGVTTILNNIFFKTNSYSLDQISHNELDYVCEYLQNNKTLKVEVGGHTDTVGSLELNDELSVNRAKVVRDYLIKSGIDSLRIIYQGYGYSKPIDTNRTSDGRRRNRRTELKVLQL